MNIYACGGQYSAALMSRYFKNNYVELQLAWYMYACPIL